MPDTHPTGAPEGAPSQSARSPLRVLLAGGGTAGHVNPLLATAAALRDPATGGDERAELLVLGTKEGLEDRLVPEAGYDLAYVPRVPMPRRPTGDLFLLPRRLQKAVIASREAIERVGAQVVVGFGGFGPGRPTGGGAGCPSRAERPTRFGQPVGCRMGGGCRPDLRLDAFEGVQGSY